MARSRSGESSPPAASLSRYCWALINCSRTNAADFPRVPGEPPAPLIELVPLAILMPPAMEPSSLRSASSSTVTPSRSLRYAVWPERRCPEPDMRLAIVIPPARAFSRVLSRTSMESRTLTPGWMGEDPSPPWTFPTCECVQTRPGKTNLPFRSMTLAPFGIVTSPRFPTAAICSPSMRRTPSGISGAVTGMI